VRQTPGVAPWRLRLAERIESVPAQRFIVSVILVNAVVLALYLDPTLFPSGTRVFLAIDLACLAIFSVELILKLATYRAGFFRSGWNIFDVVVVSIALVPGQGVLSVLRTLRVLRVLRLLTVVPSLRKVVAAFIHSIPGLGAVVLVMSIFFYAAAVMATGVFGSDFLSVSVPEREPERSASDIGRSVDSGTGLMFPECFLSFDHHLHREPAFGRAGPLQFTLNDQKHGNCGNAQRETAPESIRERPADRPDSHSRGGRGDCSHGNVPRDDLARHELHPALPLQFPGRIRQRAVPGRWSHLDRSQ
jgi:hypothetical protein